MDDVSQRLIALAELFKQRNKEYGDGYLKIGEQAFALLGEITLRTPQDYARFQTALIIICKIARYTNNFSNGGHPDSLDDLAVYSMMLRSLDEMRCKN